MNLHWTQLAPSSTTPTIARSAHSSSPSGWNFFVCFFVFVLVFRFAIKNKLIWGEGKRGRQGKMIESMLRSYHRKVTQKEAIGSQALHTHIAVVVGGVLHLHQLLGALDLVQRDTLRGSSGLADSLRVSLALRFAFLVARRRHERSVGKGIRLKTFLE